METKKRSNLRTAIKIIAGAVLAVLAMALILNAVDNFMRYRDVAKERRSSPDGTDPRNATYSVDGATLAFKDGNAVGASMFGIPTEGDLDGDGDRDAIVMFTIEGGGSGTFFYVAAAINGDDGFVGTDAVLVGDRIAPQTTAVEGGQVVINYATRRPWEPFTAQTSVGKTKRLSFTGGALREVPGPTLSREVATGLATRVWGDCTEIDCTTFTVETLDGVDGVWYVQATYDGLMDDSIKAERKIAQAHAVDGGWSLGAVLITQQQCREGRGHQEFSTELCI